MFWLFHAESLENIFQENALKPLIESNYEQLTNQPL
jgi:hypothetical protein